MDRELEKRIMLLVAEETIKMQKADADFGEGMATILANLTESLAICAAGAFMCSGHTRNEIKDKVKGISEHIAEIMLEKYDDAMEGKKERKEKRDEDGMKPRFNFN